MPSSTQTTTKWEEMVFLAIILFAAHGAAIIIFLMTFIFFVLIKERRLQKNLLITTSIYFVISILSQSLFDYPFSILNLTYNNGSKDVLLNNIRQFMEIAFFGGLFIASTVRNLIFFYKTKKQSANHISTLSGNSEDILDD